ncbi:G protein-coupled receptor gpr1 [Ascochyta clinopodiicola]|nr:G protein-coupled receptor gpr1 [Ascochyta clinopodiicola]
MAGLAFVNPTYAYVSQGAFCTLPIRPFWYRLALTWIPRYIIILMIIGLAVAIYAHVGFEFRSYSNVDQSLMSLKTSDDSTTRQNDEQNDTKMEDITFELSIMQPLPEHRHSISEREIYNPQHQVSSALVSNPCTTSGMRRVSFDNKKKNATRSLPGSTLNLSHSRTDAVRPAFFAIASHRSVTAPISPLDRDSRSTRRLNNTDPIAPPLSSVTSTRSSSPSSPAQDRLAKQRQRIHRQLRLMFIYPIVYTLMWAIPFAMHCMNYWDKWAMDPVETLRVGGAICITLMGFADALIFSIREKPWRSIEGSDSTFWGSFACRKSQGAGDAENDCDPGQEGQSGSGRARGSTSYRTSSSGDYARIVAEQARARLDIERGERLAALEFKQRVGLKEEGSGYEANNNRVGHDGLNARVGDEEQVYDDIELEDDTA